MSLNQAKKAFPGVCLGSVLDTKPIGPNVYVYQNNIYSSVKGTPVFSGDTVEVVTSDSGAGEDQLMASDAKEAALACKVPREGCEVFARVDKVEDRFCRLKVLAINDRVLQANTHFTGMLFKENVRDYDRDGFQMHKCFVPNDIVKARVI